MNNKKTFTKSELLKAFKELQTEQPKLFKMVTTGIAFVEYFRKLKVMKL